MRLFLRAFALPFAVFYAAYFAYINITRAPVIGGFFAASYFRRDLLAGTLENPIRDPGLVILGDSSAKFGIDPRLITEPFAVNLAAIYGNAIHAYTTLHSYYESRPAPRCAAYISNFEWKRGYNGFLLTGMDARQYFLKELREIRAEAEREGLFPADRIGAFEFWGTYVLSRLYLRPVFFNNLASRPATKWHEWIARMERARGHMGRRMETRPAELFEDETDFADFTKPFEPSPTEDHYLKKLASMTRAHGTTLFVGSLPVAEGDLAVKSAEFRSASRAHARELLKDFGNVRWIELAETAPKEYFWDFTHLNARGADLATPEFALALGECHSAPERHF